MITQNTQAKNILMYIGDKNGVVIVDQSEILDLQKSEINFYVQNHMSWHI